MVHLPNWAKTGSSSPPLLSRISKGMGEFSLNQRMKLRNSMGAPVLEASWLTNNILFNLPPDGPTDLTKTNVARIHTKVQFPAAGQVDRENSHAQVSY